MNRRLFKIFPVVLSAALFVHTGWLHGEKSDDDPKSDRADSEEEEKSSSEDKDEESWGEEEKPSVTHHEVELDGGMLRYAATAGYVILRRPETDEKKREKKADADGMKPVAKMFYIAYTRTGGEAAENRPVMFCFNGGPGASSIWLHMGALGPKRTVLSSRGEALPPPARLEENPQTWLDQTDLVFIDPVSTGFSRAAPGEDPKQFHGYQKDIESVGEFIRLYLTKNERWASPKFLIGESYGTTRAAGLTEYLQNRHGIYLNGVVLVSSILNFQTIDASPGNDTAYPLFLPSFTATAWYHEKLPADLQDKPLAEVLSKAEEFASNEYLLALFRGGSDPERIQRVAAELSRLTGLRADYITLRNLRITASEFMSQLLRGEGEVTGRFDGRFRGLRDRPGTDGTDYDPSFEAVNGPFTATFNEYVRRELGFKTTLEYETIADVWPWKLAKEDNRYLDVAGDLRQAMLRNPYLKVWICSGSYDLATPYFASSHTANQMALPEPIRDNLTTNTYPAGHMLYLDRSVLRQWKLDSTTFIQSAILPDTATVESARR